MQKLSHKNFKQGDLVVFRLLTGEYGGVLDGVNLNNQFVALSCCVLRDGSFGEFNPYFHCPMNSIQEIRYMKPGDAKNFEEIHRRYWTDKKCKFDTEDDSKDVDSSKAVGFSKKNEMFAPGDFVAFDYGKFGLSFGIFKGFGVDKSVMQLYLFFPGGNSLSEKVGCSCLVSDERKATEDEIQQCIKILSGDRFEDTFPKPGDYVKMLSRDGAFFYGICEGVSPRFIYFYASIVDESGNLDADSILFDSEILRTRVVSDIQLMDDIERHNFDEVILEAHGKKWNVEQMCFKAAKKDGEYLANGRYYWTLGFDENKVFVPEKRVSQGSVSDHYLFDSKKAWTDFDILRAECGRLNDLLKSSIAKLEEMSERKEIR